MIVVDENLAVRVVRGGRWPAGMDANEDVVLPTSRYWRLRQSLHATRGGQLSRILAPLSLDDRDTLRLPHPEILQVLDSRPPLDEAAQIAARYGAGWLVAETLVAGFTFGRALWFGTERNAGRTLAGAADGPGIAIHFAT